MNNNHDVVIRREMKNFSRITKRLDKFGIWRWRLVHNQKYDCLQLQVRRKMIASKYINTPAAHSANRFHLLVCWYIFDNGDIVASKVLPEEKILKFADNAVRTAVSVSYVKEKTYETVLST